MSTATKEPLNNRQQEIYDAIRSYVQLHGYPPTTRWLAKKIGAASQTTVVNNMRVMRARGWLEQIPNIARGIRLLGDDPAPIVYVIERRAPGDMFGWWFCGVCDSMAEVEAAMVGRGDFRVRPVKVNEVVM